MTAVWTRASVGLCLCTLLVGCADRTIRLRYAPDEPIIPVTAAQPLTIFKFADRRGPKGDQGDPLRVGVIYAANGGRIGTVTTDTSFLRTLTEALVAGFKARGVEAVGLPDRELVVGTPFDTPLALGGDIQYFSAESWWTRSAQITGMIRVYDRQGALLVEKRVSAQEQAGMASVFIPMAKILEELLNTALREFVRTVVTDAAVTKQLVNPR
jgi:hypothetical protein